MSIAAGVSGIDRARGSEGRVSPRVTAWHLPVAVAVISAAWVFARTRHHGMLGFDTWPILLTSRIGSFSDLLRDVTHRLMDGRYPGDFYRPLLSLSFALDHALWGMRPAGYHLTDAVLFGGAGLVVFFLARRLLGAASLLGPLVAMLAFLLHPTHVEVLSVPARRPELLCWLFMGLALWLQLSPRALASERPPILPAIAGTAAMLAKETGLLLPVVAMIAVVLFGPADSWSGRTRRAVRAVLPHAIALALVLAARFAVLGSIGGHHVSGSGISLARLPVMFLAMWSFLVGSQPVEHATVVGGPGVVIWTIVIACAAITACARLIRRKVAPSAAARAPRTAAFALVFLAALSMTYTLAGGIQAWYMLVPVAAFSLLLGALAEIGRTSLASPGRLSRAAGAITLLALLALAVWQGRFSPLVHRYDAWDRATHASEAYLDELSARIGPARAGSVVASPPVPRWVAIEPGAPSVRGASVLADYSIQAWLEMRYPERRIRVTTSSGGDASAGEVVVVAGRVLPGFQGEAP